VGANNGDDVASDDLAYSAKKQGGSAGATVMTGICRLREDDDLVLEDVGEDAQTELNG